MYKVKINGYVQSFLFEKIYNDNDKDEDVPQTAELTDIIDVIIVTLHEACVEHVE